MRWISVGLSMGLACGGGGAKGDGMVGEAEGEGTVDDGGPAPESTGGPATSVGESDGEGTTAEGEGTTVADESTGAPIDSFDTCLASMVFELDCTEPGTRRWVAWGESFGCVGVSGGSMELARVLFRLDETVEGEPQIRGLRLGVEVPGPTDEVVEWTAPAPVPYAAWTPEVAWPLELTRMVFAGGLSFLVGRTDDATITFAEIPSLDALMNGTTLRGDFTWNGGDYDILQPDGSIATIADPTAQGAGCFHLPGELYPLELD